MQVVNLKKTFYNRKNTIVAVDDVNLEFNVGKITGLIGYNGSGKTTIFNLILDFIPRDHGLIQIDGREVDQKQLIQFGFIPQNYEFNRDELVMNNMKHIGYLYGLKKSEVIAKIKELATFFDLKANLKRDTFKKLSKGNVQKVALIQLFLNPHLKYLILDEPFEGLDPVIANKIMSYIMENKAKYATIISSHRLDIIEKMIDHFYVLKEGKIVFDSRSNTLKNYLKVLVNKEVNLQRLKAPYIKSATLTARGIVIEIESEKDFSSLSKLLVKDPNYKIHRLIEEKLTTKVLEKYQND